MAKRVVRHCSKCGYPLPAHTDICPDCGTANRGQGSGVVSDVKKMKRLAVLLTSALVVVLALLVLVLVLNFGGKEKEQGPVVTIGETVLTIDGRKIPENEFLFLCSLVLEDESVVHANYQERKEVFTETVKEEAVLLAQEYVCRLHEAQKSGLTLTAEEETDLENELKTTYREMVESLNSSMNEEQFYAYFYGLTKAQFVQFKKDWALIEKFDAAKQAKVDVNESNQQAAFDLYQDLLAGRECTVIVLSLEDLAEEKQAEKKDLAQDLLEWIQNGTDMLSLVKTYGDDKDLSEAGGKIKITGAFASYFPELYAWSETAEAGALSVVESDEAVYVVRCEKVVGFAELKDSEELLYWTRFHVVNQEMEAKMAGSRYQVQKVDVLYKGCDISTLCSESITYWTAYWEANGFPVG